MQVFTKSALAAIREGLAYILSHSQLDQIFALFDFEANPRILISNKITKCSAYLDHCDWSDNSNTKKLLDLLSDVRHRYAGFFSDGHFAQDPMSASVRMESALNKAGIFWTGEDYSVQGKSIILDSSINDKFDLSILRKEIQRARQNIDSDPDDAITAAENIVVSSCKHVLEELNVSYTGKETVGQLLSSALKAMELLPDDISEAVKGAESVKKIVRSLAPIVQGIAELRNIYGDAHGKGGKFRGLQPRHARLIVGAAETVGVFLIETLAHKKKP